MEDPGEVKQMEASAFFGLTPRFPTCHPFTHICGSRCALLSSINILISSVSVSVSAYLT